MTLGGSRIRVPFSGTRPFASKKMSLLLCSLVDCTSLSDANDAFPFLTDDLASGSAPLFEKLRFYTGTSILLFFLSACFLLVLAASTCPFRLLPWKEVAADTLVA